MRLIVAALVLTALISPAGCGIDATPKTSSGPNNLTMGNLPQHNAFVDSEAAPPAPPTAPNSGGPRVITDLSQLSSAPTAAPMNSAEEKAFIKTETASGTQAEVTRYNIDRFYLAQQPFELDPRQETAVKFKGDVTLLNKKAARYPEFSYEMLNRTLPVAERMAAATLGGRELPSGIRPVILTATLTPTGRLSDIAIEQHSGVADVDHIMIDACKQGLWGMNPPAAAAALDKSYKVHFEGVVYNYSYNRYGVYTYITHIGVGLL
ncbi:MAG TPA: hypothetical protein VMF50_06990 [Candidatus Binataceae bacterium]|nr:hypothetical protein [Candidatus Binataceae bacterium]